jgi:hypothetical protein
MRDERGEMREERGERKEGGFHFKTAVTSVL